ncbi:MAG: hypothetical protein CO170_04220 [candidate division SR1 bacterium CG_4_9_14_3_um_filter_40_9]|nr:MAG: hypothetical protein CO170_04220 [candidate division SR1 bacterium CG_4_9_14_3_um_filter_40_9]
MARTKKERHIKCQPVCQLFGPLLSKGGKEIIELGLDEYEAIRLSDYEKLAMIAAAKKMKISAPTFCRILQSAHKKVADALINNKSFKVCIQQCK